MGGEVTHHNVLVSLGGPAGTPKSIKNKFGKASAGSTTTTYLVTAIVIVLVLIIITLIVKLSRAPRAPEF